MKKKFLMIGFLFIFIFTGVGLYGCGNNELIHKDISISGYENYTNIGIGELNARAGNKTFSSGEKTLKPKLIGLTKDGVYETIEYNEDPEFQKRYNIYARQKLGQFIFLNYRESEVKEVYKSFEHYSDFAFILDTKTGKMFDITKYQDRINIYTRGVYAVTKDCFITEFDNIIYKYSFKDNQLEVKEIFKTDSINNFQGSILLDIYQNVYFENYILSNQGTIKETPGEVKIAYNDIAYIGNKWYNQDAELVDATFVPTDMLNMKQITWVDTTILKKDNVYYHRDLKTPNQIIKYTILDDIRYTIETITLTKYENNEGVIIKDRIYFINNQSIYYVSILDGTYTTITSNYIFNKLYTDNQGNICFTGITESLQEVTGHIKYEDNSIDINITESKFDVFFIFSIN